MNKKNFDKIVLVSLCDNFTNQLGTAMSQNLGMLFCDTKELVEYELVDKNSVKELCSLDYLKKCEKRTIKHIASFESVVVSINYDYLIRNIDLLKEKGLVVFVELSKSFVKEQGDALSLLAYADRTKNLQDVSDICVSVRKTDIEFVEDKVLQTIGRML